jgi:hypothetical protein
VFSGFGDVDAGGNGAAEVDLGVKFDPGFGVSKRSPREQSQRQIYGRRIQCVDAVVQIEIQFFVLVELAGFSHQPLGDSLPDTPVSGLVGIRKSGLGQWSCEAEMVQCLGLSIEAVHDIPQSLSPSQLSKCHGDKLLTTCEVLYLVVPVVLPNLSVEGLPVNFPSDLRYDVRSSSHGPAYIGPFFRSEASHTFFCSKPLAA